MRSRGELKFSYTLHIKHSTATGTHFAVAVDPSIQPLRISNLSVPCLDSRAFGNSLSAARSSVLLRVVGTRVVSINLT
jgi:hypothetical protein